MGRALCIVTPFVGLFGTVAGQQDCPASCFHLDTGAAVGIIVGDIILTLLIALSVYCFVSRQKKNRLEALESKGKTHASSKRKKPDLESTYQELQGVQNDVYSDLRHLEK
ncbi:TYRO protein tyrosine kinase-binding protein [Megalops cyprinoides]|uniref:TYRO protein tyrosine kinase-binding protein n=1 Tax=Megalops cyprinoides TaxID=118141 RepID=UPI001864BA6A|nr:TYRO protein tyrosine kinase-binding protein [Megalops cyprinoides]